MFAPPRKAHVTTVRAICRPNALAKQLGLLKAVFSRSIGLEGGGGGGGGL